LISGFDFLKFGQCIRNRPTSLNTLPTTLSILLPSLQLFTPGIGERLWSILKYKPPC